MISGFTYVHNALNGGYPVFEAIKAVYDYVDEMVIVDVESNDGTRELLDQLARGIKKISIIDGRWMPGKAGACLAYNHAMHVECENDVILHFEADEVYDDSLLKVMRAMVRGGNHDLAVHRLQLEQNFQRVRWYPTIVHRVFPKGTVHKHGETTDRHGDADVLSCDCGYLWDITNCFRDNWFGRVRQNAEMWGNEPKYHAAYWHASAAWTELSREEAERYKDAPVWTYTNTPFSIPEVLRPLVGKVRYEPNPYC